MKEHLVLEKGTTMRKILFLHANLVAGFLDFAVGACIGAVFPVAAGEKVLLWQLLVAGIYAVLPDLDIVYPILRRSFTGEKFRGDHHEYWSHWPLFMLLSLTALAGLFGGNEWATIVCICLVWHFCHDAVMMRGHGVRWFFRMHPAYSSQFGREETGWIQHDEWIERNWLQPSLMSCAELGVASVLFIVSCSLAGHALLGVLMMSAIWLCLGLTWYLRRRI